MENKKHYQNGKFVKIPKYIKEALFNEYGRKCYVDFEANNEHSIYCLAIYKRTPQTLISTHKELCERIVKWCTKHYAIAEIIRVPEHTHYTWQTITIFVSDPVMKWLEDENLIASVPYEQRHQKNSGY